MCNYAGAVVMWLFWPSLNGCKAVTDEAQLLQIVNTHYALTTSYATTFAIIQASNCVDNVLKELHITSAVCHLI